MPTLGLATSCPLPRPRSPQITQAVASPPGPRGLVDTADPAYLPGAPSRAQLLWSHQPH